MIIIRKAEKEDLDSVVELWKEFSRDTRNIIYKGNPGYRELASLRSDAHDIFRGFAEYIINSISISY